MAKFFICASVALFALVHHALGRKCETDFFATDKCADNCQLAMRHRGSIPGLKEYSDKMSVTDFTEGKPLNDIDCENDLKGCMIYQCIDGDGNEIFRFNSCEDKNNRCDNEDHELKKICQSVGATPMCNYCVNDNKEGNCNNNSIELSRLGEKTTTFPPPPPPTPPPFKPPHIVLEASIEKGGGVMSLCNFTFTFLLFLGGVLVRWMMEM